MRAARGIWRGVSGTGICFRVRLATEYGTGFSRIAVLVGSSTPAAKPASKQAAKPAAKPATKSTAKSAPPAPPSANCTSRNMRHFTHDAVKSAAGLAVDW